jgi:hypothetical protein
MRFLTRDDKIEDETHTNHEFVWVRLNVDSAKTDNTIINAKIMEALKEYLP